TADRQELVPSQVTIVSYPGRTPTEPPVLTTATALATPGSGVSSSSTVLASPGMSLSAQAVQALGVSVLDRHETELVEHAMAVVASHSPADATVLQGLIAELKATSDLLDRQRPLRRPTALGGEARDESTLIDHLCTLDGLSGDLALPLKATQSRTYLLTKINFLRGFVKATSVVADGKGTMAHDLREELAQSIYTLLAEELFLALLRKPDV